MPFPSDPSGTPEAIPEIPEGENIRPERKESLNKPFADSFRFVILSLITFRACQLMGFTKIKRQSSKVLKDHREYIARLNHFRADMFERFLQDLADRRHVEADEMLDAFYHITNNGFFIYIADRKVLTSNGATRRRFISPEWLSNVTLPPMLGFLPCESAFTIYGEIKAASNNRDIRKRYASAYASGLILNLENRIGKDSAWQKYLNQQFQWKFRKLLFR